MPRFDKTGPSGQGALTGRGLGACNKDGAKTPLFGRGLGRGRGMGRSNRRFSVSYNATSLEDEKTLLENRLNEINQELDK